MPGKCRCVSVHAGMCTCVGRSEVDVRCLSQTFSTLFFEMGSPTDSEAQKLATLTDQQALGLFLSRFPSVEIMSIHSLESELRFS